MNNCTDANGGWALGCRIDGGQAEYVRVPYADQGLNRIPDAVSDEQALFVGDAEQPTAKDKGRIMKTLMPRVKGKADGGLVNQVLGGFFA